MGFVNDPVAYFLSWQYISMVLGIVIVVPTLLFVIPITRGIAGGTFWGLLGLGALPPAICLVVVFFYMVLALLVFAAFLWAVSHA